MRETHRYVGSLLFLNMSSDLLILDSHCDTASQLCRGRDMSVEEPHSHVDIPKMLRGGVGAMFFAAYCPASLKGESATNYAKQLLRLTESMVESRPDVLALAKSADDIRNNHTKGLISILLAIENGEPICDSLELLHQFYDMGVRYMTLCHSADNLICDSCASSAPRWNGLSPFGKEVVKAMNSLGMLVDVSHISDKSFYDVLETSSRPVVATHSCCRALAHHPRNMTDEMIRKLAEAGGVIQVNFYPVFLDDGFAERYAAGKWGDKCDEAEEPFIKNPSSPVNRKRWYDFLDLMYASLDRTPYERIVDHIDHIVELVGIDYVGIGSDFDGISVAPHGMEDVSCISKVFDEMRRRGYSEEEISKVASGNFLRIFAA